MRCVMRGVCKCDDSAQSARIPRRFAACSEILVLVRGPDIWLAAPLAPLGQVTDPGEQHRSRCFSIPCRLHSRRSACHSSRSRRSPE
ncbi:hypothetical protein AAFF_G00234080 [Aldrovandia affinis]|uniref:Uncharacterized protein n=1 Tax=Aldrovandia affinis TaxID=143900 RepID=A0AAD7RHI3_9TELE|nr:hypothetical protein AAFF_G00234080 [Aldrovandia affinis]